MSSERSLLTLVAALCLCCMGSRGGAAAAPAARLASRGSPAPVVPAYSPAGLTFLTRDEALALAFPDCEVKRGTRYLSKTQQKRVAALAKSSFDSGVVYPYVATRKGERVGTAYFDTHRVRTLRETLMVVVGPNDTILRVELLSFAEPKDYIPRGKWYGQFADKKLDEDLSLKRKIRGVTGATLTAKATTACARRVLALHRTLAEIAAAEEERKKKKKKKPVIPPRDDGGDAR